jgi:hypothetical protein
VPLPSPENTRFPAVERVPAFILNPPPLVGTPAARAKRQLSFYGAQVDPKDVSVLVEYLNRNFGKQP